MASNEDAPLHSDETLAKVLQAEEDEALARALAASLSELGPGSAAVAPNSSNAPAPAVAALAARLRPAVGVVARHAAAATLAAVAAAVPLARLRAEVADGLATEASFRALDGEEGGDAPSPAPPHPTLALVASLAAWFKADPAGFAWVDAPPCAACGGPTSHAGNSTHVSPAEAAGLAGLVELYRCAGQCGGPSSSPTRFPRLNYPVALWRRTARRGRCGEWANAFGALLAAAGLEARHVVDVGGDHVWCEVWVEGGGEGGGGGGRGGARGFSAEEGKKG